MRIAVYPGTFDPITNGHVDLINRGLRLRKTHARPSPGNPPIVFPPSSMSTWGRPSLLCPSPSLSAMLSVLSSRLPGRANHGGPC